jgi:hypothetical protein
MKRFLTLIAAATALGLAAFAYAGGPEDQAGAAQPSPAEQASMPSIDPATLGVAPTDPSAMAQSSPSASPSTRLAALVPSGMSAQEACAGFRTVEECAATLHASQNLNIPFEDLKSRVTGGTRLAAAIHQLKPDANVKAEVRKAEEQARSDTRVPQG